MRDALEQVIHLPLNYRVGEGKQLGEKYRVGPYFPVFILTDTAGEVINRWTGYTGADRFLRTFYKALSNLTTIDDRIAAFEQNPNRGEALFLATYHSDIKAFVRAAEYYQRAQAIGGSGADYSYQIFENYASAAWNDQVPFDDVFSSADAVINAPRKNLKNVATVAQLMSKLARRMKTTDRIGKYLQAGIAATGSRRDARGLKLHAELNADLALYVNHDTAAAIRHYKSGLGKNWDKNLDNYYPFADFCFERRINLEEAQEYALIASQRASDGPFKAKHLSLLANICEARGLLSEALRYAEETVMQDPDNETYSEQLERIQTAVAQ